MPPKNDKYFIKLYRADGAWTLAFGETADSAPLGKKTKDFLTSVTDAFIWVNDQHLTHCVFRVSDGDITKGLDDLYHASAKKSGNWVELWGPVAQRATIRNKVIADVAGSTDVLVDTIFSSTRTTFTEGKCDAAISFRFGAIDAFAFSIRFAKESNRLYFHGNRFVVFVDSGELAR